MTKWRKGMSTETTHIFNIDTQKIDGYILNVESIGEIHRVLIKQEDIDDVFENGLEALSERRQIDFWKYEGILKLIKERKIEVRFKK